MKDLLDHIVIDPHRRSGKPCIRGTRITVYDILEYLAGGMSTEELLSQFPELTRDDVQAVLQFAAARERGWPPEHELPVNFRPNLPRSASSRRWASTFPGSEHVIGLGLDGPPDSQL